MPNPKRKHTRSRRDSRRSANWKLESLSVSSCSNCGAARRPHTICGGCGFYNGKLVLAPKQKKGPAGEEGGEKKG